MSLQSDLLLTYEELTGHYNLELMYNNPIVTSVSCEATINSRAQIESGHAEWYNGNDTDNIIGVDYHTGIATILSDKVIIDVVGDIRGTQTVATATITFTVFNKDEHMLFGYFKNSFGFPGTVIARKIS